MIRSSVKVSSVFFAGFFCLSLNSCTYDDNQPVRKYVEPQASALEYFSLKHPITIEVKKTKMDDADPIPDPNPIMLSSEELSHIILSGSYISLKEHYYNLLDQIRMRFEDRGRKVHFGIPFSTNYLGAEDVKNYRFHADFPASLQLSSGIVKKMNGEFKIVKTPEVENGYEIHLVLDENQICGHSMLAVNVDPSENRKDECYPDKNIHGNIKIEFLGTNRKGETIKNEVLFNFGDSGSFFAEK